MNNAHPAADQNPDIDFDTFQGFPKIPRMFRQVIVTEKIDGTNAQVIISADGQRIRAASRNRFITPEADNFGFARWVHENRDELIALGPGRHFGEWWGAGIQRRYNLDHKRFSLFNTLRWNGGNPPPSCCGVVPVLYDGLMSETSIRESMSMLAAEGSVASPGFMNPEGVVVFH